MLLTLGELVLEQVILATSNGLFGFNGLLHDSDPILVDLDKLLGLYGHLFGDISSSEDSFQTGPRHLDLDPEVQGFRHF